MNFLSWYYGDGLKTVALNGIRRSAGFLNYFSVLALFETLFSPWHRIAQSYGRGFNPQVFFSTLAGNVISRVLGAIVRSIIIVVGIIVAAASAVFGVVLVALWIVLPVLLPLMFLGGVFMIFA